MKFSIRKLRTPDDFSSIAELINVIWSEPITAQHLADEDSKIPATGSLHKDENGKLAGHDRLRIVAVDEQDRPIGYGISWRAPWTAAGELHHLLVVDPENRSRGAGSALYHHIERWASEVGASKLNFEVNDDDEASIAFAHKHGFEIERHTFESVLDLSNFDLDRAEKLRGNVDIRTLAQLTDSDKEYKLYELYKETSSDIPGFSGDYFDYSEWRKWTLELPGSKPEYVLIAMDGEEYMGVAHMLHNESTNSMYHEYTGVRRSCRCRGIGMSLKIESIRLARSLGVPYLRTNNDSLNKPMLHINRDRLGFQAVPGTYKMVKSLSCEEG